MKKVVISKEDIGQLVLQKLVEVNTDKESIRTVINNIVSKGTINPFNPKEIVIDNVAAIEISFFDGALWLGSIRSFERGGGRKAMNVVLDAAQSGNVTVRLIPEPFGNDKMDKAELIKWYESFGFTEIDEEIMEWKPKEAVNEDIETRKFSDMKNWSANKKYQRDPIPKNVVVEKINVLYPKFTKHMDNVREDWKKGLVKEFNLTEEESEEMIFMFWRDYLEGLTQSSFHTQHMGVEYPIFDEMPHFGLIQMDFDDYFKEINDGITELSGDEGIYDHIFINEEDIFDEYYMKDISVEDAIKDIIEKNEENNTN